MFCQKLQLKSRMPTLLDFQILVRKFLPFATIVSLAIFFSWLHRRVLYFFYSWHFHGEICNINIGSFLAAKQACYHNLTNSQADLRTDSELFWPIMTYMDQLNQPESTRINPYQPVSTSINPYQPVSTRINPYQPESTQINLYQPVSTWINPNQ